MLELLASILGGGATGILGGLITKIFEYFNTKQKIEQDKLKYAHEEKILEIESSKEIVVAREKGITEREVAELSALAKSYDSDKATYFSDLKSLPKVARIIVGIALGIVDLIRGLTRPVLTIYLCVVTTYFYVELQKVLASVGYQMTAEQAYNLVKMIIMTVLYLTTTAVSWWFASRAKLPEWNNGK